MSWCAPERYSRHPQSKPSCSDTFWGQSPESVERASTVHTGGTRTHGGGGGGTGGDANGAAGGAERITGRISPRRVSVILKLIESLLGFGRLMQRTDSVKPGGCSRF